MSSQKLSTELFLNGIDYQKMDHGPQNINEWLTDWKTAKQHTDTLWMLSLLHWGLQLPLHKEKDQVSVVNLFCHYLAVADGHQSPENFQGHDFAYVTIFGEVTDRELKQKLADKAWTELCNRAFVFTDDGNGQHLKYDWHFRQPELASAFIRFIDPNRWENGKFFCGEKANLSDFKKSAYHAKAYAFTCRFLQDCWQYREILQRQNAFRDDLTEDERTELASRVNFFHLLKPQLVSFMVYYQMVDFLHDKKLDAPVRRVLRDFALNNSFLHRRIPGSEKVDLGQTYGILYHDSGSAVIYGSSNREAARILLLYPLLVAGRRQYIRSIIRKKQEEKKEAAKKLAEQVRSLNSQLEALKG